MTKIFICSKISNFLFGSKGPLHLENLILIIYFSLLFIFLLRIDNLSNLSEFNFLMFATTFIKKNIFFRLICLI